MSTTEAGYLCDKCNYNTDQRTNMIRHKRKHRKAESLMKELVMARGLIRTYNTLCIRMNIDGQKKGFLEMLLEFENRMLNKLKKFGAMYKQLVFISDDIIAATKVAYNRQRGDHIDLSNDTVTSVEKNDRGYILKTINLIVDDDQHIDEVVFKWDDYINGYTVDLIQEDDLYDTFFVYM